MGAFKTALIVLIPVVGLLASYLPPKLEFMGVGRVVVPFNNGNCLKVEGLEACEDAWIHQETGLAYLFVVLFFFSFEPGLTWFAF